MPLGELLSKSRRDSSLDNSTLIVVEAPDDGTPQVINKRSTANNSVDLARNVQFGGSNIQMFNGQAQSLRGQSNLFNVNDSNHHG